MTIMQSQALQLGGQSLPAEFELAQSFLTALDESAESFCFQTFDDNKHRKDPALTRVFNGSLEEHWQELEARNRRGAGVFVTVNATDGKGRKAENIIRIRAIWQEADRPNPPIPQLEPHMEVLTSEEKHKKNQRYWLIDKSTAPLQAEWDPVMNRQVKDYGSDPNAKDIARVLRLPGFYHQKNPDQPHLVRITAQSNAQPYPWAKIVEAIPPYHVNKPALDSTAIKQRPGKGIDCPLKVRSALAAIDPDCDYDIWLRIGMALHHATAGGVEGFTLFDEWSALGSSYREGETAYKWSSFGRYHA